MSEEKRSETEELEIVNAILSGVPEIEVTSMYCLTFEELDEILEAYNAKPS